MKGYRIRVTFVELPTIWRQLVIPAKITFAQLHRILQTVMDWKDYHLYEFIDEQNAVCFTDDTERVDEYAHYKKHPEAQASLGPFAESIMRHEVKEAARQRIDRVLDAVDAITYIYDFGDHWVLSITVEERLRTAAEPLPLCLDGREPSPPDDVGGPGGYFRFLEAWHGPKDEDDREWIQWALSRGYHETFSVDRINRLLQLRVPAGKDPAVEVAGQLTYEFFLSQRLLAINPKLDEDMIQTSHIFQRFRSFLQRVHENSPLKATQKGNLPRHFVRALYNDGFDYVLSLPFSPERIMGEDDALFIGDLHELAVFMGFIRRQKGRIQLTKRGLSALEAPDGWLYLRLMQVYVSDFHLGFFEPTPAADPTLMGHVLTLLHTSPAKEQPTDAIAAKLFPYFANDLAFAMTRRPEHWEPEREFERDLTHGVFGRWLVEFGLVTARDERIPEQWYDRRFVTKTPLLDGLVKEG